MIPPAPAALLPSNPHFAALHKFLVTSCLDRDCSTHALNAAHAEVAQQLNVQRIQIAKRRILLSCLASISNDADNDNANSKSLPKRLRDLIALIVSFIPVTRHSAASSPGLTAEDWALLAPEIDAFRQHRVLVSKKLDERLRNVESDLAAAAAAVSSNLSLNDSSSAGSASAAGKPSSALPHPTPRPASHHRQLSHHLQSQTTHLQRLRTLILPDLIVAATDALAALLRAQATQAERLVGELETRKHGAEARHVLARAAFAEQVTGTLGGKVGVCVGEGERDAEGVGGGVWRGGGKGDNVRARLERVKREVEGMERRRGVVEGALGEFVGAEKGERGRGGGVGNGTGVMRRLGLRYREIERELEEVKRDVERLRRRRDGKGGGVSGGRCGYGDGEEGEDEDETWIR